MTKKPITLALIISAFVLTTKQTYAKTSVDTVIIAKSYQESYKKPLLVYAGTTIINKADSLYLINDLRFRYYEKLRMVLEDSLDIRLDNIIFKYEKLIQENEKAYNDLLANCNKTSELNQKIITTTQTSLQKTSQQIDSTQVSLNKANESLNKTEKLLKKSRNKQTVGKLSFGIGGLAIGLLIGILAF